MEGRGTEDQRVDAATLPKLSADAHVDEPHDLWFERVDESLRDRVPRRIQSDEDGAWRLVVDGSPVGWVNLTAEEAVELEAQRVAAASPEVRIEMMRTDGVNGEVIYPTIGLYVYDITDPHLASASCDIYNRWIRERLGGEPRIKLAAMIPALDVASAIAAVERAAADEFAAFLLPLVGTPSWNTEQWEPLWAVLEATARPVVMHQGTGHDMIFYRGWGSATANLLATQSMAAHTTALLACGGVLERHPALHFVLVEVNAGWLAWAMSTLDQYYVAHAHWSKPKLRELPSWYIRRQIHATFQDDPVAIHNLPLTGAESLLWGNDYPHPESTYPQSNAVLEKMLRDVGEDDARRVTSTNAAELFGFDDEVIAMPA
jgi:predicted TIM-barrel fold metal-dependent hydrolase